MRYFDKDFKPVTLYSSFDKNLIGFKGYQNEEPMFFVFSIPSKRFHAYNLPLIVGGDNFFTEVSKSDEELKHALILAGFDNYKSISGYDFFTELFYREYYNIFTNYAEKISHSICEVCHNVMLKCKHRDIMAKNEVIKHVDICQICSENILSCSNCCIAFFENDGEETRDGSYLCPKCKKRNFILPYHRLYPNINFFGKVEKDNPQPYLGIELEVDEGGETNSEAAKIMNIINANNVFAYCSHDGSLNNGFEIITQPATLKYHNSIKHIYKQIFDILLNDGYTSHDTNTCGFHIHFNRDFYADNEEIYITRLLYLVDKFWDDIVRISRRNQRRMSYTKKIDMPASEYLRKSNKTGNHSYHYYAVNLVNANTIEFRMFRGTLKIETFMATLQFVNNCILAAKTKNAEEIQQMDFEELITGRTLTSYWKKRKGLNNTEE